MLRIDIETHDRKLGFDMAGVNNRLSAGTKVSIPGGGAIEFTGTLVRKAVGIPEVLQFLVDTATNLEYGLLATWLAQKVDGRQIERITINRRIVTEITASGIRQVIEEVATRE